VRWTATGVHLRIAHAAAAAATTTTAAAAAAAAARYAKYGLQRLQRVCAATKKRLQPPGPTELTAIKARSPIVCRFELLDSNKKALNIDGVTTAREVYAEQSSGGGDRGGRAAGIPGGRVRLSDRCLLVRPAAGSPGC
jgi:hypothetical protein